MRMVASRTLDPRPAQLKKQVAHVEHVAPPLKGLSLAAKQSTAGDKMTAPILKNFIIEDDRIQSRAGYVKDATCAGNAAIWHLIPNYGTNRLLAATNNTLCYALDGTLALGGFHSNDWSWTTFSNLGVAEYTIMVNGVDGVWSWDGTTGADPGPVPVTRLTKSAVGEFAKCTVSSANILKFRNGQTVTIAGAVGTGMTVANGAKTISNVNTPPNTFTLVGVDTSAATADQTSGVTADPPAGTMKETVTGPAAQAWINPNQFNIVLTHMNRLFFADSSNLAVYYLPVQSKSGEVKALPLNAVFRRGGTIRALYTWTLDGGAGMDDQLVIFSSNGEAVIYSGTDPDTNFSLVGIYRFDAPLSKHCVSQYGGELYVLVSTGLVPMSTMMKAESENLGQTDRAVISVFMSESNTYRANLGWQTFLNPSSHRMFCNIPQGLPNKYKQLVRHMPRPVWSEFADIPARCWGWIDPYVYFGDDNGNVYRMHPIYRSDNGKPINLDVQMAWSQFKTPGVKQFKMVQAYMITDGDPRPYIDIKVNYDYQVAVNQPDTSFAQDGAEWDVAEWDVAEWVGGPRAVRLWNGVTALGRVGAPRLMASVKDCSLAITGFDVIYETGSVLG
jgi:hypothetical protein